MKEELHLDQKMININFNRESSIKLFLTVKRLFHLLKGDALKLPFTIFGGLLLVSTTLYSTKGNAQGRLVGWGLSPCQTYTLNYACGDTIGPLSSVAYDFRQSGCFPPSTPTLCMNFGSGWIVTAHDWSFTCTGIAGATLTGIDQLGNPQVISLGINGMITPSNIITVGTNTYLVLDTYNFIGPPSYTVDITSFQIEIGCTCDFNPGNQILTAPGSLIGPVHFYKDVIIQGSGDFTLQAGDFMMARDVLITVDPGVNLVLDEAHLYSCDHYWMWKGIKVLNGGNVTSSGGVRKLSTLIEDAEIAIDVENIAAGHANPLLNLDGVVFNGNYIGIKFHNSALTNIPVLVKSCVFASRVLPTGNMSWHSSSHLQPGLRYAAPGAFDGLNSPCSIVQIFPYKGLKSPFAGTPGILSSGIRIENIGNTAGAASTTGIDLSSWANPTAEEFNLFDSYRVGIHINNANLTTINNVFQNNVYGIADTINGLMNARLSLTPQAGSKLGTGNKFWNCGFPIDANNVLDFDIEKGVFRGKSTVPAIALISNRFNYRIKHNQFNGIISGISMNFSGGAYNINNSGIINGIYADSLVISQNYFGPQVNNSTPLVNNMSFLNAITLTGNNNSVWNIQNQNMNSYIESNVMNRIYTGVGITGMRNYHMEIRGNRIDMHDTYSAAFLRVGIGLISTQGANNVSYNEIRGYTPYTNHYSEYLVYANSNINPVITCNMVSNGGIGFEFEGNNTGTWMGNIMYQLGVGIHLNYNGIIGTQGHWAMPSGNQWWGGWPGGSSYNTGIWATAVNGVSDAANSKLYINSGVPYQPPLSHWQSNFSSSYSTAGNLIYSPVTPFTCPGIVLPALPAARGNLNTFNGFETLRADKNDVAIYPNPTSGAITLASENESENFVLNILDVTGKIVFKKVSATTNYKFSLELLLEEGIYIANIHFESGKQLKEKLVIRKN